MNQQQFKRRAYNIDVLRSMARRALPRMVFDFVDGGADDELTLRANEQVFDKVTLWPRYLNGAATRDLSVTLFGQRLSMPVLIGPTGLAGLLWPRGEAHSAAAAASAGTVYVMSHGSTLTIEDLARAVPGPKWFQLFMFCDRALTQGMADRAAAAGYDALVLTIDNQLLGWRERDFRNGFTIPPRFTLANSLDMATHWRWGLTIARQPRIGFANYITEDKRDLWSMGMKMGRLLEQGANWDDVAWLRRIWQGPLLLKGVLHPEEARRAVEVGVDGLFVSNHGGRQLDGAPASLEALPAIAAAVDGRIPLVLDGGVRRGTDVVKALALGATACAIGRPQLWGLAAAGLVGVRQALDIFRREIDQVMGLMGISSLDQLRRADVTLPGEPAPSAGGAPVRPATERLSA